MNRSHLNTNVRFIREHLETDTKSTDLLMNR